MEFIIKKIMFNTEEISVWHEKALGIWNGEQKEVPAFQTKMIYIAGHLVSPDHAMDLTVSYDYDSFKDLTIEQVIDEVTRRIKQNLEYKNLLHFRGESDQ